MIVHLSPTGSKSPHVFKSLYSKYSGRSQECWVRMISILILIYYSSSTVSKPIPSAPMTIGMTVTVMLHSFFFSSLAKLKYFFYLFTFCYFHFVVCWNGKNNRIIFKSCDLVKTMLTDGFSHGSECQQAMSCLQDYFQNSGRCQQCRSFDGLDFPTVDLQLYQAPFQTFGKLSKSTN